MTATVAGRATAAGTVETRRSWLVAWSALGILSVSFGAPLITIVALKPIAAEFGGVRSVPALAYSLAWLGSAVGGIAMGQVAERVGVRWTVTFGAVMIAAGLVLSSVGESLDLHLGHGLLIGLLGNAGINAPLYVYVARWFDRRRGTALALIASGQAAAGTIWAPLFGHSIEWFGWRRSMQFYAVFVIVVILPAASLVFRALPKATKSGGGLPEPAGGAPVLGFRPRTALALACLASFLCCVPMAMPQGHLVAFCSDVGIPVTRGSAMLSLLLACAFLGRQFWGFVADRIGGLRTVLAGSACQITAMTGFLLTQDEAGLFAVSAVFGLSFSGLIPAYVRLCASFSRPPRRRGGCRPCCCAAAREWLRAAGSPARFMITRGSMRRPSPLALYSTSLIYWSSVRWCSAKAALRGIRVAYRLRALRGARYDQFGSPEHNLHRR